MKADGLGIIAIGSVILLLFIFATLSFYTPSDPEFTWVLLGVAAPLVIALGLSLGLTGGKPF